MPCLDDIPSMAKISQFEQNLEAMEEVRLQERIEKIFLPANAIRKDGRNWPEGLITGAMGQYARQLVGLGGEDF